MGKLSKEQKRALMKEYNVTAADDINVMLEESAMKMRTLGKHAIYNGNKYEFIDLSNGKYALISYEKKDMELGFELVQNTESRFIKYILLNDLDFVFERKSTVIYQGDEFIASIIKGNQVMLYTGDIKLGRKYEMNERDRYEYWLYVDLKDIDEIVQKWIPLPQYMKK